MTAHVNHQLTTLLKRRVLKESEPASDGIVLRFADASTIHVKTNQPPIAVAIEPVQSATITQVRQQDTTLVLEFESGKALSVRITEPSASVLIRDGAGELEYAD
jgi:hypothetical protein